MRPSSDSAQKLKQLLIDLSPVIEEYTALICPHCRQVCCKQRHGIASDLDKRYFAAIGERIPFYEPGRLPGGTCQFMGPAGCVTPRWLRPWRCTWYFCEPLLDAMNRGPQKKARQLSAMIQEIVDIRGTWR